MDDVKGSDPLRLADAEAATPVWAARGILAVGLLAAWIVITRTRMYATDPMKAR